MMLNMKVAVYWGCKISTSQYSYELSLREVARKLGVELVDIEGASCCGDPIKGLTDLAATYLSARNMALAGVKGSKNLLVPCNRCHLQLSLAKEKMKREGIYSKVNSLLRRENLLFNEKLRLWHPVDFLHGYIGLDKIGSMVKRNLKGVRVAVHPGCGLIRPSKIGRVDESENPKKVDEILKVIGVETIDYPGKLDCCGAMLMYLNRDAALTLAGEKLKAVQDLEVDCLVDTCPNCHEMLDFNQSSASELTGEKISLPVVYLTQLIGFALGIEEGKLGFQLNRSPTEKLLKINFKRVLDGKVKG